MNILYFFKNYDTMMFQWQKYHIIDELKEHNCNIDIISPLQFNTIEQANEAALKQIRNGKYDLFLTCHNGETVFTETINEINRFGVPTLLFCPDNLVDPFKHEKYAEKFDLVWLTSRETEYIFKKWSCNTIFLPYAANPNFLKPTYFEAEIERLGFIGTPHGSRIERINTLVHSGIPMSIHSNAANFNQKVFGASFSDYFNVFKNNIRYPIGRKLEYAALIDKLFHRKISLDSNAIEMNKPVPLDKLGEMNSRYAMMLSFTDANSTGVLKNPVNIVNLRSFEIPMSGGLQFTTHSDELEGYFEDGKEIVLASTVDEYIEKAKFYLKPEQSAKRLKMKQAARKRAESEHTWYNRFSMVFENLGIKVSEN